MGLYGGLVAVVRCLLDQVGRGPGTEHHQLVHHPRVHAVEGQHALDELERPYWVVIGQKDLGDGCARHALWLLLQVGPDLVGAGQVAARCLPGSPSGRQHPRVDPDPGLAIGVAGSR